MAKLRLFLVLASPKARFARCWHFNDIFKKITDFEDTFVWFIGFLAIKADISKKIGRNMMFLLYGMTWMINI